MPTSRGSTARRPGLSKSLFLGIAFITAIGVGLGTFAAVRALYPGPAPSPAMSLTSVADRKPLQFSMPALDGKTWTTSAHAGHVVLLNYFATWCAPCLEEFPDLRRLQTEFGPRGLEVAAISINQPTEDGRPRTGILAEFNERKELPFPILLPPADSPLLHSEFPIPQSLLIDRRGKVALHVTGPIDPQQMRPLIEELLREPAGAEK